VKIFKTLGALALLMTTPFAQAVETVVTPGVGTLEAAIAAATDGDVLLLQTGTYSKSGTACAHLVVDKSITIRAVSKAANPIIESIASGGCSLGLQVAAGKSATIQGVQLDDGYFSCDNAASVRLLENVLNVTNATTAVFNCGADELVMVGNTVVTVLGQPRSIGNVFVTDIYFAGNTIVNGYVDMRGANLWVVGNRIDYDNDGIALLDLDASSKASVIGNRLSTPAGKPFDDQSGIWTAIRVTSGDSMIASNIITPVLTTLGTPPNVLAILKQTTGGSVQVLNNVYYRTDALTGTTAAIAVNGPGLVAGNIIVGHTSSNTSTIDAPSAPITNNICFNNTTDCGTADGNLTADPQFVDTVDFELGPASPGIDAGPVEYQYADLDRTRNDIGAYGGPWELGQYDAQRNSSLIAPYVYPLFDTNSAVYDGKIHVRSLGVARLR
jgi:hypothetical protein